MGRFRIAPSHTRVVEADFGVMDGRFHLDATAQAAPGAIGAAVDHMAHQIEHVLVRAAHPVLHCQEVGAHVLRRAWNKAQHLRQAAQHLHLRRTPGGGLFFAAAQFFQQRHRAAGGLAHIELAQARELGDFGGRGDANHGVALHAPGAQIVQDGQEMVFQKQHASHHDVRLGDIGLAARNPLVVARVFRRGVQTQAQARKFVGQGPTGALHRTRQVRVHGHDHELDRRVWALGRRFSEGEGTQRHWGSPPGSEPGRSGRHIARCTSRPTGRGLV